MVSQTAVESLEELKAKGLEPSFADVIRLNALGLKLEAANKKHAVDSLTYLPRACAITKDTWFRQPTIGHEIWIDSALRLFGGDDSQTDLAVRAFALSRDSDELPKLSCVSDAEKRVRDFLETMARFTTSQIYAAIDYVYFGASPLVGENPPRSSESDDDADLADGEDWKECIALGVMNEGRLALWGMSQAELEKMTRQQLEEQIMRAYIFHGFVTNNEVKDAQVAYYSTLAEIETRLNKDKESRGEHTNGNK